MRSFATALLIFTLAVLALYGASVAGLFAAPSLLSGCSFLPVSWLTPLVLLAAVAGFAVRRRALAAAAVAGFAVVALVAGDYRLSGQPEVPEGEDLLTVVALNARYYSFGRPAVLGALRDLGADVALLSENVLTPAEAEQMKQEALPADFRMGRTGETALISRLPILEFKEVDLPSHQASLTGPSTLENVERAPHRSFAHAIVDAHGTRVHVISIRLIAGRPPAKDLWTQLRWGRYLLETQLQEVEFFERYVKALEGPVIFGGDLNATPPSFAVRRLAQLGADSFLARHRLGTPTFRVSLPTMRLDYLFATPDLVPSRAEHPKLVVSDHYPVLATYRLARAGR